MGGGEQWRAGCCWQSFANADSPPTLCMEVSEFSVGRDDRSERGGETMNNRKHFGNSPEGEKIPDAWRCSSKYVVARLLFCLNLKKKRFPPSDSRYACRICSVRSLMKTIGVFVILPWGLTPPTAVFYAWNRGNKFALEAASDYIFSIRSNLQKKLKQLLRFLFNFLFIAEKKFKYSLFMYIK